MKLSLGVGSSVALDWGRMGWVNVMSFGWDGFEVSGGISLRAQLLLGLLTGGSFVGAS